LWQRKKKVMAKKLEQTVPVEVWKLRKKKMMFSTPKFGKELFVILTTCSKPAISVPMIRKEPGCADQ
jgi:hypothetical protein